MRIAFPKMVILYVQIINYFNISTCTFEITVYQQRINSACQKRSYGQGIVFNKVLGPGQQYLINLIHHLRFGQRSKIKCANHIEIVQGNCKIQGRRNHVIGPSGVAQWHKISDFFLLFEPDRKTAITVCFNLYLIRTNSNHTKVSQQLWTLL